MKESSYAMTSFVVLRIEMIITLSCNILQSAFLDCAKQSSLKFRLFTDPIPICSEVLVDILAW
jgi:hypothetical protein